MRLVATGAPPWPAGGACSVPPDPGGSGKRGEGGRKERGGPGPQCLKCVDAHADLPIIIKQLLTFWYSGAQCTGVPERQKLIKIVNKWWRAYIQHHSISTRCWNSQRLESVTSMILMNRDLHNANLAAILSVSVRLIEYRLTEIFSVNREHPYCV